MRTNKGLIFCLMLLVATFVKAQAPENNLAAYIRENYTKREVYIPMRDGVRLFTAIYEPKDKSQKYPILLNRTPYSVAPYGPDKFKEL
ncbi:MAG: CocE/NonD family hydrolase, partial [Pyrinomonadaceae bacterium]